MAVQASCVWKNGYALSGQASGNITPLDAKAPVGKGEGMTPKELVLVGLCGCTAMDVIALMRKGKQPVDTFEVAADAPTTEGHPSVFSRVDLVFRIKGGNLDHAKIIDA